MDLESLRARREARRRMVRRRRAIGAGLLGATVLAVLATVVAVGSGGGGHSVARRASTARGSGAPSAGAVSSAGHTSGQPPSTGTVNGRATGRPGRDPVPILMYHVIAAPPAGAPFPGLYVTPSEFAAQMNALKRAGWHAVTLDQAEAYWHEGVPLPSGKPIVLSFDNGYRSQYTEALPILRGLGWVGVENMQLTGLPPSQGGLSSDEIHNLVADGWELDTQGFSHADLITLDAQELHYQVAVARTTVQKRFGVPVNWFCYPSGHYDATVIAAVKAAGYEGSTTVIPGWAHPGEDPYRLHRLRVLGGTTAEALVQEITAIRANPPAPASYG